MRNASIWHTRAYNRPDSPNRPAFGEGSTITTIRIWG